MGLEPTTYALRVRRSTTELRWHEKPPNTIIILPIRLCKYSFKITVVTESY